MGPHKRTFQLNPDASALTWISASPLKSAAATRVDLTSVTRITKGQSTIPFVKNASSPLVKGKEAMSFR